MSDAMTNREIEDVLTSIRRLVSQEGVRTAPQRPAAGRLVLTPAQRIDDTERPAAPVTGVASQRTDDAEVAPAPAVSLPTASSLAVEPEPEGAAPGDDPASKTASEPVAGAPAAPEGNPEPRVRASMPAPDFSQLEATIAELEAAVSASGATWEPDGSEGEGPGGAGAAMSNVTALYAKAGFMHRPAGATLPGREAGAAPADVDTTPATQTDAGPATSRAVEPAPAGTGQAQPAQAERREPPRATAPSAPALDDTPDDDDLSDTDDAEFRAGAEDAVIDEEMLCNLVAQMVREELHGQLGERITLQVRKLVRAEIARVLDERKMI